MRTKWASCSASGAVSFSSDLLDERRLFGVRFVASEFNTGAKHRGRIDTLGLDEDGSPVVIEYKELENENVINQGLFYLDWLTDHRGDFERAAEKVLQGKQQFDWSSPRLILLAQSF